MKTVLRPKLNILTRKLKTPLKPVKRLLNPIMGPVDPVQLKNDYLDHRRLVIKHCLEIPKWLTLSEKIAAFKPDVIVLLAPKMPLIYKVLKFLDPTLFNAPLVISDFAIDYLPDNYLKNKKIAIVADYINNTTSMLKVKENLKKFSNVSSQCFAISKVTANNFKDNIKDDHEYAPKDASQEIVFADPQNISLYTYRLNLNYLYQSFICLTYPVEIEFPVLYVDTPKKFDFDQFIIDIDDTDGLVANRQDGFESFSAGINKISVDVFPGRGVNDKWRFYFDMAENRLFFVPMAHLDKNETIPNEHNFSGRALSRYQMYCKSLVWGKKCFDHIRHLGNLPPISLDHEEVSLLFGRDLAKEIIFKFEQSPTNQDNLAPLTHLEHLTPLSSQEETLYFYDAFKQKNIEISGELFVEYFINFFQELRMQLSEDDHLNYAFDDENYGLDKDSLDKGDVCQNRDIKSCLGPTFKELLLLMKPYLERKKMNVTEEKLHTVMSKILDQQIDQGFVVPTFDTYGRRIFTTGEAFPYDRSKIFAMKYLGIKVNFKNFQDKNLLSKEAANKIAVALHDLEMKRFSLD